VEHKKDACTCDCQCAVKLIFPCSGASNVGEMADLAARRLTKAGAGKMYCLAGIGGGVSGIIESTKSADKVLVIDGCPVECARKIMEKAGFSGFTHLQLAKIGLEKGKTPVTPDAIATVVEKAAHLLEP
jgi:uncharacterized metal-binding protein